MDFIVALIGAAAVLTLGLMLLCAIATDVRAAPPFWSCSPDGVAITSDDKVRLVVMMLDHTIATGRGPDGRKMSMLDTRAAADEYAQAQVSPMVTLAMLEQCDQYLLHDYSHGYWMLSSALVRESARRRATETGPLQAARAP